MDVMYSFGLQNTLHENIIYLSAPLKFKLEVNASLNLPWFWFFGVNSGAGLWGRGRGAEWSLRTASSLGVSASEPSPKPYC